MGAEGVDVPKRGVSHASPGIAIVQKLANVGSAAAHLFKPWLGDASHLVVGLVKPSLDVGVAPDGAREVKEGAHDPRVARPGW
jgi:hypothetical protein